MGGPGLRERKKQATRDALSLATLRLAVERGFHNVLVEDIAAAAQVSPRTFNNYFAGKAEAIASRHGDRVLHLAAALRDRPAAEPLWGAITEAAIEIWAGPAAVPDPSWPEGVRLTMSEPALVAAVLQANLTGERVLAAAVARRTGADPDADPHPALVAGAVGVALRVAMGQWLRPGATEPIDRLLRSALGSITAGLPAPSTA